MLKIKVEHGVAIPHLGVAPKPIVIPFGDLKVGDSFHIKCGRMESSKKQQWVRHQARKYRMQFDRNYSIRISPDEIGFRVWRVN